MISVCTSEVISIGNSTPRALQERIYEWTIDPSTHECRTARESVLMDRRYHIRWPREQGAWIEDNSKFKIAVKSRRGGLTFAATLEIASRRKRVNRYRRMANGVRTSRSAILVSSKSHGRLWNECRSSMRDFDSLA
jgi:hypothetical protein